MKYLYPHLKNISPSCLLVITLSFVFSHQKGEHVPLSIKIGDVVLLPEYGGTKVELDDNKEYHLFRESDILAKVEV